MIRTRGREERTKVGMMRQEMMSFRGRERREEHFSTLLPLPPFLASQELFCDLLGWRHDRESMEIKCQKQQKKRRLMKEVGKGESEE